MLRDKTIGDRLRRRQGSQGFALARGMGCAYTMRIIYPCGAPVSRANSALASPKKPANLSINSELLEKARGLGINLSSTLEERLGELVRQAEAQQWLKENRKALDRYNASVEKYGVFGEEFRSF